MSRYQSVFQIKSLFHSSITSAACLLIHRNEFVDVLMLNLCIVFNFYLIFYDFLTACGLTRTERNSVLMFSFMKVNNRIKEMCI